jgi:uncharacterized membrane protein
MTQTSRESRRSRRAQDEVEDKAPQDEGQQQGQDQGGAVAQLRGVASEAAVSVLSPVAKKVATQLAKMAVERGPELIEDTVLPKLQDAGGMLGNLGERFGGGGDEDDGGGGKAGDGTGKGRRMPIQQAVDVAAPLETVYDQWTQFEDFPKFMHRVEKVEQRDDTTVVFHEKVWGVRRMWEAEIVEQVPDERIVWKTTSGMQHVGVVTFHQLSDRLTRVELNVDIDPEGAIEKIARGARFAKRAARADLKRFKAFVEMRDEETGAWRGVIEDGDVREESSEDEREDEREEEEPEAYEDAEPDEDEAEDEDEEPETEAYEDEDEDDEEAAADEEEDDEEPSRRATAKSKRNGGRAKSRATKAKPKSSSSSSRRSSSSAKSKPANGRRSPSRAKASSGKRSR